jgi:DNA primase
MPLIDFKIHYAEQKYDLSDTTEKRRFLGEALAIVAEAESESVREELLKKLRDKTGITYNALERDLRNVKKGGDEPPQITSIPTQRIVETDAETDKSVKAKRFILAAKLFAAPYAKDVNVSELPLTDEIHRIIARYISVQEESGARIRPSELFEVLDEDCVELNEILDLNYGDKLTGEVAERFFIDSLKTLQSEAIEKEIASLNKAYAEATEEEEKKRIAKRLGECIQKKNTLKKS